MSVGQLIHYFQTENKTEIIQQLLDEFCTHIHGSQYHTDYRALSTFSLS